MRVRTNGQAVLAENMAPDADSLQGIDIHRVLRVLVAGPGKTLVVRFLGFWLQGMGKL